MRLKPRPLTDSTVQPSRTDMLREEWGATPGWWLFAVPIRILVVIDGRINTGHERKESVGFGLGPMLDALRQPFALHVQFYVDVVKRDPKPDDLYELEFLEDVKQFGFRFTQEGFSLDEYDQLWLFGDWPGFTSDGFYDDTSIDRPEYAPPSPEELKVIAEWMDRGGGVFATGDHGLLGATLSSKIPRVRAMRRWTYAQGALPQKMGPSRHETLTPAPIPIPDDGQPPRPESVWEVDRWPQKIFPVYSAPPANPLFASAFGVGSPHPLLCSRFGVIDLFPDHMHEGEVMPDDEVVLDAPVDITGYTGIEFPIESGPAGFQPRPTVIAHGVTTHRDDPPKSFGLIGAYDGDRAGVGRIVVDSTWHHWFSMNVLAFVDNDNLSVYYGLQAYFRNVGMWLATPAQRADMLLNSTWGAYSVSAPNTFDRTQSPWQVGELALDVIGRWAPRCFIDDLVTTVASAGLGSALALRGGDGEDELVTRLSTLPPDVVARAVIGSIGTALMGEAMSLQEDRGAGRQHRVDERVLRERANGAVQDARRLLVDALERVAADGAAIREELTALESAVPLFGDSPLLRQGAEIRIVVERLELPHELSGRSQQRDGSPTLRLRSGDAVVTDVAFPADAKAERDVVIFEGMVSRGHELSLEVLMPREGDARMRQITPRFTDVLSGEPEEWIGSHAPDDAAGWALRYRVERVDHSAED